MMELNERGLDQAVKVLIESHREKKIFDEEMEKGLFEKTQNLNENEVIEIKSLFHQLYEQT